MSWLQTSVWNQQECLVLQKDWVLCFSDPCTLFLKERGRLHQPKQRNPSLQAKHAIVVAACMPSHIKSHPWEGNICSLFFQFLPKGYNFVTWAVSTKPAWTDSELCDCVPGQGMGEEFEAVVHSDPKGERVPGNWASAETQEFKISTKVNVSLQHGSKLLTVD
jgi:hypothetical protein